MLSWKRKVHSTYTFEKNGPKFYYAGRYELCTAIVQRQDKVWTYYLNAPGGEFSGRVATATAAKAACDKKVLELSRWN